MDYQKKTSLVNKAYSLLRKIEAILIGLALLFAGSTLYDMYVIAGGGRLAEGFSGFDELIEKNPDVVAWIIMDGTHIDHPVVKGTDNFEYLDKSYDGTYYQGGSIFLDEHNAGDFSDSYIIIHGHHMSQGAMFSDISNYLEKEFFSENYTGELITPGGIYQLTVAGSSIVDAYNGALYYSDPDTEAPLGFIDDCRLKRDVDFDEEDKLVLLSTCAGDMTSSRAVVFCRARYIGEYNAEKYIRR